MTQEIITTKIAIFQKKEIRKTIYNDEWWFSVVDIIGVLTDSTQPSKYWTAMKARVGSEDGFQLSTICRQLKLESSDGKKYETDCADTEGIFRIIQSIPSPKAEQNAQGFIENKFAAQKGGSVAGEARKDLEKKSGKKVSTNKNYLLKPEDKKRLK